PEDPSVCRPAPAHRLRVCVQAGTGEIVWCVDQDLPRPGQTNPEIVVHTIAQGLAQVADALDALTSKKPCVLTDETGLLEPIRVEGLGRIALEDAAFLIDVVTLSVDRRRGGVRVQGCHSLRDGPREVEVVGVEVSEDAPTRLSPAFVDRVSLPVVRL